MKGWGGYGQMGGAGCQGKFTLPVPAGKGPWQPAPQQPAAGHAMGKPGVLIPGGKAAKPAAAAAAGGNRSPDSLIVTGCQHATIGSIVRGSFLLQAENHGRPTFKKSTQANGLDVMLYFWDERDGPALCGWWFGPKVGGDQVWAFHSSRDYVPPGSGWMVPFNGPSDPTLIIKPSSTPSLGGGQRPGFQPQQQSAGMYQQPGSSSELAIPTQPQAFMHSHQRTEEARKQQQQQQQQQHQQQQQEEMRRQQQQKQQEEMRKRMEENKKKMEEANRKRKEEQEVEMKKKVEEQKKRLEDIKKKKEDEEREKRELQVKRAQELKSMTEIRKVQQKMRVAKVENFDELKRELEDVLEREIQHVGDKQQQVQDESEKVVAQVQKRIDAIKDQKRNEEEKKREAARKQQEMEEEGAKLLKELCEFVEEAEKSVAKVKERATAFTLEAQLSADDVEAAAAAIKAASAESETLAANCSDFFRIHHPKMKLAPNPSAEVGVETPKAAGNMETRQLLAQLLQRIGNCKRDAGITAENATKTKQTLLTRADALQKMQEMELTFKKYDKDSDEMLSRKEVLAYSSGEFDFSLTDAAIDTIWRYYAEYSAKHGDQGVTLAKFQLVKVFIGVQREMHRDKKRRSAKADKQRRLEEMKALMHEKIKKAAEAVSEADQALTKAEEDVKPLSVKSKGLRVPQMKVLADEIGGIISAAKVSVSIAQQKMGSLKDDIEDTFKAELITFITNETKKHESKLGRMDGRIARALNLMTRFQDEVGKKRAVELEKVRAAAVRLIRYNQQARNQTEEELFSAFDPSAQGVIEKNHFLAFFDGAEKVIKPFKGQGCDAHDDAADASGKDASDKNELETVELASEDLAEIFDTLCHSGETTVSKETFMQLVGHFMVVVKQTAITDGLGIKESKTVRRLEPDEVVKVVKGPVKEDATGVMRHQILALKDDVSGWVSAVGNAGTVFLKEGGRQYKVVKETVLTDAFELPSDSDPTGKSDDVPRKLKVGDVVEAMVWPKKDPTSGFARMKVKVKSDGAVGWVTSAAKQGTFLKVLL